MDFKLFFIRNNILNLHYKYISRQSYKNNNDKYIDNFCQSNKIKKVKLDKIKNKNIKIFNSLFFCIIFILLNPSNSNLKISLQIKKTNTPEPILFTKNVGIPSTIK